MKFITLAACTLFFITQTHASVYSSSDDSTYDTSNGRGQLNDRCYVGSTYWNCKYPLTCVADNIGYTAGRCLYECQVDGDCSVSDNGPFCINKRCTCKDADTTNNDNDNCNDNLNGPTCVNKKCRCQNHIDCVNSHSGDYCSSDHTCGCRSTSDCPATNKCSSTRGVCYCNDSFCEAGKICNFNQDLPVDKYDRDAVCTTGQCREFFTDGMPTCSDLYNDKNSCNYATLTCQCDQTKCDPGTFCNSDIPNDQCTAQCNKNQDCPNKWQSCNNHQCVCDSVECQKDAGFLCTNNNADGVCQCDTTACNDHYQPGSGNGNQLGGTCQETASGAKCIQGCDQFDQFNSPQCDSGSVCVSNGGNGYCYPNNINCLNSDGTADSHNCPSNMYCQQLSGTADVNSPFCVPQCLVVNDFCQGFQCPADYAWSMTGVLCANSADGLNKVCSCVKPA